MTKITGISTGLLGAAALALSGCAPAYPEFGEAQYRLEGVATALGGEPSPLVIYRDGPMMRVETTLADYGEVLVVYDAETRGAYALDPPVRLSNAPDLPPPALPGAPTAAAVAAPQTLMVDQSPRVTGVAMRIDDAQAPQPMELRWALMEGQAQSVGACRVAGEPGHEWAAGGEAEEDTRIACITRDGIVLRIRTDTATLFEATSLERGAQSPELFGVPAGYDRIDRAPLEPMRPNVGAERLPAAPRG